MMTANHDLADGLDKVNTSEAIASIHLLVHEVAFALIATHHRFRKSDTATNGMVVFETHGNLDVEILPPSHFVIDSIALEQYREMVQSLRDSGARIVYVVPPLYEPFYEINRAGYAAYMETLRRTLPPAPVIDFDGPEYVALRSNPNNFSDCYHVTPTGAVAFTALLEELVPKAISSNHWK
jgi:hypothetical protein